MGLIQITIKTENIQVLDITYIPTDMVDVVVASFFRSYRSRIKIQDITMVGNIDTAILEDIDTVVSERNIEYISSYREQKYGGNKLLQKLCEYEENVGISVIEYRYSNSSRNYSSSSREYI